MRFSAFAFSLTLLAVACAGCGRSAPAVAKPLDDVQKPVAVVAPPPTPLGEDANGKAVTSATIQGLTSALKNPDADVRRSAVQSLARVRWKLPEPVAGVLMLALDDADPGVRIEAVRIAGLDPQRSADVARLLQDKDARVRMAAAQVLVGLGKHEQDAYAVLVNALGDRHARDRRMVMELIRAKAPTSRPAVPALIAIAQDPGDPLRIQAIGVLALLGAAQESVDTLLLTAHDAEPHARAAALRALARLDATSAKVQVAMVKAVRDPNVDVKLAATEGVGSDGIPTLIELLRQNDEGLRDAAARALGRIGPGAWAAGADLQRLAQSDPAERVRQSARTALQAIIMQ